MVLRDQAMQEKKIAEDHLLEVKGDTQKKKNS